MNGTTILSAYYHYTLVDYGILWFSARLCVLGSAPRTPGSPKPPSVTQLGFEEFKDLRGFGVEDGFGYRGSKG